MALLRTHVARAIKRHTNFKMKKVKGGDIFPDYVKFELSLMLMTTSSMDESEFEMFNEDKLREKVEEKLRLQLVDFLLQDINGSAMMISYDTWNNLLKVAANTTDPRTREAIERLLVI